MQTDRILLRRWQLSDADSLYKYASDPEVGPRAGWPAHQSVEESRTVIRDIFTNDTTWAIVLRETNEPIGAMGYFTQATSNIPIGPNDCEIGYWVAKPYWNQGICTEALRLMLDYCLNVKHFGNIWSDHFVGNPASGRVMEKCGFRDTGRLNRCSNLLGGDRDMVRIMKYIPQDMSLYEDILLHADPAQLPILTSFFKTGPGQYSEGDRFLGLKMPAIRALVAEHWRLVSFSELERCILSPYHEHRMAALLCLVSMFRHAKNDVAVQQQCIDFYLAHIDRVDNWDLVDTTCDDLLGAWLYDRDASLLYDLARNGETIWQQRIGIVSTMYFIHHDRLDDTYAIADIFLAKPAPLHDLLQKAVGWLLREAGKRDEQRLCLWLDSRYTTMPRTLLRYALERLPEPLRRHYMKKY